MGYTTELHCDYYPLTNWDAPGSTRKCGSYKDGCENDGIVVCCGLYWLTTVVYYDSPSDKIGCCCYSGQSSKDSLYALRVVHVGKIGQHLRFVHGYNMYVCRYIYIACIGDVNQ